MERVQPSTIRLMGTDVPARVLWAAVLAVCGLAVLLAWLWLDRPAALWALGHRDREPWSSLRGALGPLSLIPVLLVAVPSAVALRRGRKVAWSVLLVLLWALAASNLAGFVLKRVALRARPAAVYASTPAPEASMGGNPRHSFPSGDALVDTTLVVALWGLLGWRRRWGWLLLVPLVVGAQRFIAAAHFPSDIMAGWVMGAMLGVEVLRAKGAANAKDGDVPDPA